MRQSSSRILNQSHFARLDRSDMNSPNLLQAVCIETVNFSMAQRPDKQASSLSGFRARLQPKLLYAQRQADMLNKIAVQGRTSQALA